MRDLGHQMLHALHSVHNMQCMQPLRGQVDLCKSARVRMSMQGIRRCRHVQGSSCNSLVNGLHMSCRQGVQSWLHPVVVMLLLSRPEAYSLPTHQALRIPSSCQPQPGCCRPPAQLPGHPVSYTLYRIHSSLMHAWLLTQRLTIRFHGKGLAVWTWALNARINLFVGWAHSGPSAQRLSWGSAEEPQWAHPTK
jgi:hypothetical protein